MLISLAIHHAVPEHVEAFLAHMDKVVATTTGAPGLIDFTCWAEADGRRLIGLARWESREAFEAALRVIGSHAHERRAEWTDGEDELLLLTEATAG